MKTPLNLVFFEWPIFAVKKLLTHSLCSVVYLLTQLTHADDARKYATDAADVSDVEVKMQRACSCVASVTYVAYVASR